MKSAAMSNPTCIALPFRVIAACGFLGLLLGDSPAIAAPEISGTTPRAVQAGEGTDLIITGKDLTGATSLWTSFPAEASLAADVKDNGKAANRVVFRVKPTDPNTVGVHAIRVVTPTGVSPLQIVVVDDLPTLAQTAGNTSPEKAQVLSLPTAVDGVMPNLGLNFYRFSAEAGQKISIEVLARRMGSALDPMLRLIKVNGPEIAYSDDAPGLLGDARLCHTFAEAGDYILEVRDIRFQGGANHRYRLRIGDFPCINVPYPLGVQRGKSVKLSFAGSDLENLKPLDWKVSNAPGVNWLTVGAKRTTGSASGFATVRVGDAEELLEKEPNNTPEQAQKTTLDANFNGLLQAEGDVDRFTFPAKKGAKFTFESITRSQGSPADLVLKLYDAKGKKLSEADDTGTEDAVLNATFPADGDYTLTVEDLHGRGGSAFAYRIAISETLPGFALDAVADRLNVPKGGVEMMQIVARRSGYNGPIAIRAENLPAGITVCPTVIGPGQKGINLCLKSTQDAKPGTLSELKIIGEATVGGKKVTSAANLSLPLKAATNQMPYPPANLLDSLAVAVSPEAPFSLRTEPQAVTFDAKLTAKFKVIVTRQKDYNEAITLAIPTMNDGGAKPVPGLLATVKAALKPIPAGKNEIEITLTADKKAPKGDFSVVLNGSLKKGKTTINQPVESLTITIK